MSCGCNKNVTPGDAQRTVFEVVLPDHTVEEFANFGPAQRRRNEVPGAKLRSATREAVTEP